MQANATSILGEGNSSICRRGLDTKTGGEVAIKIYKDKMAACKLKSFREISGRFMHQIEVLTELQEPFHPPDDPTLWNEHLADIEPPNIFVQLLDHSRDRLGKAGPDILDDTFYIIMELSQCSLKDYLEKRRQTSWPMSTDAVRSLSKSILVAMSGLHAKGFVHLDMKPENLMMCGDFWKIIDVEGCARIETDIKLDGPHVSFSPLYCAPEWARFLVHNRTGSITASACLDAWSVGMTLCELVSSKPIMKRQFYEIRRAKNLALSSTHHATLVFIEWLSNVDVCVLPESIDAFDPAFVDLLSKGLLVGDVAGRKTCAQCLLNPFIQDAMPLKSMGL
jgi:serine/threonine protein kinase